MNSEQTYFISKLKKECKVYYFKNNLSGKNPNEMNDKELMVFVEKNNLEQTYAQILCETAMRFETIKNKFKAFDFPKDVLTILDTLYAESKNSYLVGGCTRDVILNKTVKDFDFATDISYNRLGQIFPNSSFKETGTQFLVFNLNFNGVDYEIANFRKDSAASDGRRPDSVQIGTIKDDAERRDFTVNNIYWNRYDLYILEDSVDDILTETLKFVGTPEDRINEDLLRGIRFYRLLNSKQLKPDKESLRAIRRNWDKIITANSHRIMLELEKMCL